MRLCKKCGKNKSLENYRFYKKYPDKLKWVCKECENKESKKYGKRMREDLDREENEVIREFNSLKVSERILKLFQEGYDISWNKEEIIVFSKNNRRVFMKDATKSIYNLIFLRYCIELRNK